ncbi:MAG: hypothetical protein A2008_03595 [Candidatus Wallbacteria bacterium GWC2_49_35]|uniref:Uncharacterized protein n=1 Tax=Candidatus Wallbacteria bacterium GWC2_49_35 TaxID=1817813 RepID=A0A1F7X296_9BACT|nr:MAG: hypothetical protein A2008_03595 [Candidatus Wallbacteria bacterium GWC2_49_35]HBC74280.1 hypothetical protein [Candidatus Wallbacteria bacterium]
MRNGKRLFNLITFFIIVMFSSVSMEAYFHHFFHEVFTEDVEKCLEHFEHLRKLGCHIEPPAGLKKEPCQFDRFLFSVEGSYFSLFNNSLKYFQFINGSKNEKPQILAGSCFNHKKSRAPPFRLS